MKTFNGFYPFYKILPCSPFPIVRHSLTFPYHFRKKSIWFLSKLGAFYNNLPKVHPIYVIWAPSSLMKPPPIAIRNFASPKRYRHIYVYHVKFKRTPPPPGRVKTFILPMSCPSLGLVTPRAMKRLRDRSQTLVRGRGEADAEKISWKFVGPPFRPQKISGFPFLPWKLRVHSIEKHVSSILLENLW